MTKKKQRKGDEEAAKLAGKADLETPKKAPEVVPGQIQLDLETPDGKSVKKVFRFRPGYPKIRVGRTVVATAALMKLAIGQEISDDEKTDNPKLTELDQEAAVGIIAELAAIRSDYLEEIG